MSKYPLSPFFIPNTIPNTPLVLFGYLPLPVGSQSLAVPKTVTLFMSPAEIQQFFDLLTVPIDLQPNYNVAPHTGVRLHNPAGGRMAGSLGPGAVLAKGAGIGSGTINGRAETTSSNPAFKSNFRHRR